MPISRKKEVKKDKKRPVTNGTTNLVVPNMRKDYRDLFRHYCAMEKPNVPMIEVMRTIIGSRLNDKHFSISLDKYEGVRLKFWTVGVVPISTRNLISETASKFNCNISNVIETLLFPEIEIAKQLLKRKK